MKKTLSLPILLGSDENAYGCARIFYENFGVKPLVYCAKPLAPTSYSRILTRRVIDRFDSPDVFKNVMKETLPKLRSVFQRLLVIPCSDYYAELVVENADLISKYSETPILSNELFEKINGKAAFYRLCEEKGLPFPETEVLSADRLYSCTLPFSPPVVIKPDNSNSYSYLHLNMDGRKKVYFCENAGEIKSVAHKLMTAGYTDPLIVQRYIPGRRALTVNAYCDKAGRVRLIGAALPILEYQSPSLIGNYAALKTVKERAVCDEAASFLENVGYRGFANLDLKYDEKRDRYVYLELNPRQGRSSYYMRCAGQDLMSALWEDAVYERDHGGIRYAEEEGIWRNIPEIFLKKHVSFSFTKPQKSISALSYFHDFSPLRALTLLKRDAANIKLLTK